LRHGLSTIVGLAHHLDTRTALETQP